MAFKKKYDQGARRPIGTGTADLLNTLKPGPVDDSAMSGQGATPEELMQMMDEYNNTMRKPPGASVAPPTDRAPSGWLLAQNDMTNFGEDPELDFLNQIGMKALNSGRVTPSQIAKGAQILEANPKLINKRSNQFEMSDEDKLANQNKTGTREITSKAIFAQPDEVDPLLAYLRGQPEYKSQQEGIGNLEDALSMVKGAPAVDDSWVKPLVALASAHSGKNLLAGYEPSGMSSKDKFAQILKYQDEIAKRKGEAGKSLLEGIGKLKTGTALTGITGENVIRTEATQKDVQKQEQAQVPVKARAAGSGLTPLEKAADINFGKFLGDFTTTGGFSTIEGNLNKLRAARKELDAAKKDTVGLSGTVAGIGSKLGIGKLIGTRTEEIRQMIDEVSAQSLKSTFPGAISDSEREFITKLRFDPSLTEEANIEKINKAEAILQKAAAKTKDAITYAEKNGSIKGYKGSQQLDLADHSPNPKKEPVFKDGTVRKKGGKTYKKIKGNWVEQ